MAMNARNESVELSRPSEITSSVEQVLTKRIRSR